MRIGRSLTITDIDSYITNYISNYELTTEQIAAIIANAQGAIGCLALLNGIIDNHVPYAQLYVNSQSILNDTWTTVDIDHATYDNIELWDSENPTILSFKYSGIYLITFEFDWTADADGYREVALWHEAGYERVHRSAPFLGERNKSFFSTLAYLRPIHTYTVKVKQTSGGALQQWVSTIFVHRLGIEQLS